MSGNAADVAQFSWMAAMEARIDALWAWVTAIAAFVWGVAVTMFNAFVAWAYPIIIWAQMIINQYIIPFLFSLQVLYLQLQAWVITYIVPIVVWLQGAIAVLQVVILAVQGKIETLWNTVYTSVFGWVEDLRKNIAQITSKIADVVSVFDKKLADSIKATEDKFFKVLDVYTRDIRDQFLTGLHDTTAPIISKINQIDIILKDFISYSAGSFDKVNSLIGSPFEKPHTLHRSVIFTTSQRWGVDLWSDLFAGVTPTKPITPSEEMVRLQVDPVVDKYIEGIFAERDIGWKDISQRVDEEIREKYYGEVIPDKTKITVPELRAKREGEF